MNQASFTIRKTILLKELKNIAKALGRMTKANKQIVVELTITDDKLTIVIPGAKFELNCETKSTAKASLGFFYFKDIVETSKGLIIDALINDNTLKIGLANYKAQTTFFEDDSILKSIKLPINYTDWNILQMANKSYTIEELRFNNLEFEISYAKSRLAYNLSKAKEYLSIYGITLKELAELVDKKINI
jgi:hypothetical protein